MDGFSICRESLSDHLQAHEPLVKEALQPFALQLQSAITKAGLLHLDLKPANLPWHRKTLQLRIVDLGMSEPTPSINPFWSIGRIVFEAGCATSLMQPA
jgi:serine/threonine protein kinase